jgi:hypothetical protein
MRGRYKILRGDVKPIDPTSGPFTADEAAQELNAAMSTIQRWPKDGLLVGNQIAVPWQITLDESTRSGLTGGSAPDGWAGLTSAARHLGTSKSNVAHLVKAIRLLPIDFGCRHQCWLGFRRLLTLGEDRRFLNVDPPLFPFAQSVIT